MSTEQNKAIVLRYHEELWNKKNPGIADELCATNFGLYLSSANLGQGPEAIKQVAGVYYTAFPDFHLTDEDLIAEGDRVAVRWTARATHTGPLMGPGGSIPPTGKQVTVTGIGFFRIQNGRIIEQRTELDQLGLMQQLGLVPPPGQAEK